MGRFSPSCAEPRKGSPSSPQPRPAPRALPDQEIYQQAFELGARCVLPKPFRLDDLRGALWSALQPAQRPARRRPPRR